MNITGISLFSGLGGDSLGMKNAGVNLIAYSELNEKFRKSHDLNFPDCVCLGDDVGSNIIKIKNEEFLKYKKKVNILFAGFPCQGFSNAGKKLPNDPRNTLFREFLRCATQIEPDVIIGENVKGLLSRKTVDNSKYIDVIIKEFTNIGYKCIFKVFKCHKYNIPQKRERLIILGIKNTLLHKYNLEFPNEEIENTDKTSLKNIVKFSMKGTIKLSPEDFDLSSIPPECVLTNMENDETENNPHPYLKLKTKSRNVEYKGKIHKTLLSFSKRDSPIHCEIIDIRKPSKTIICTYNHQPRLFVPIKNKNGYFLRTLLPNELKQIQGFPENYRMFGSNKDQIIQIGNAVPPTLITKVVKHILK